MNPDEVGFCRYAVSMPNILRVTARWSGFSGAPGFTVLHFSVLGLGTDGGEFDDNVYADAAAQKTSNFFNAIEGLIPDPITIAVEPEIHMLDDATGELQTVFSAPALTPAVGTSAAVYSGPVGAVVNWRSNAVRNGRRIRGRSFLVPLSSAAYGQDGRLLPASQTTLQNAADTLGSSTVTPFLGVWARPTAPGAADGQWAALSSVNVPTLPAVLRSRRD